MPYFELELFTMAKICFCASSGGHLKQLMQLFPLMEATDSFIVTEKVDRQNLDVPIPVYYLELVNRKSLTPKQAAQNIKTAKNILKKEKPDVIISTGVLATVPLCLLAKRRKIKIIYIESFAKVHSPTMTGKLMYRIADRFYVQWPSMKVVYPDAVYVGGVY